VQTTLLFLKPDAVQRGLVGQVLARLERKGLRLAGLKMMVPSRELAQQHYAEHEGKPFYEGLLDFVTGGPVVVMAVRGVDAVPVCRTLIGATNGRKAEPGTIRGDFGMSGANNLIHGSDSPESAQRELALWFGDNALIDHAPTREQWVYDRSDLS
jgi:nucleoside-diphosphate kinase